MGFCLPAFFRLYRRTYFFVRLTFRFFRNLPDLSPAPSSVFPEIKNFLSGASAQIARLISCFLSNRFPEKALNARKFFQGKFSETPRKRLHFHAGYGIVYRLWKFSSAGRASALQAEGHRFEPYNFHQRKNSADEICGNSSVVERYLAKVNVAGSSLVSRSRKVCAVFSKIAAAAYGAIAKW